MLVNIGIDQIPRLRNQNASSISYTPFPLLPGHIEPYYIIGCDAVLQAVVAFLYTQDPEFPFEISFPHGLCDIEVYNLLMVQTAKRIFKEARLIINGKAKENIGIYVKGLSCKSIRAYETLISENKIDSDILALFRKNSFTTPNPQNIYVFEYKNDVPSNSDTDINAVIENKLLTYLLLGTTRKGGTFGIPLAGWSKEEIIASTCFENISRFFNRVVFAGVGNESWVSSHMIISEPLLK